MIKADIYYKENLNKILSEGTWDENTRPKYEDGTPAHSKFITQVVEEYDINNREFPITTLRNTAIKMGIKEIFWIYQKASNKLSDAHDLGITWWDNWDVGDGTIGKRYGHTVRKNFLTMKLIQGLQNDPFSRRHIIDLFQYEDLKIGDGLHPCAFQTIWSVRKVDEQMFLDLTLTQRSNDYLMAGYINKIQYVAFQMMIAKTLGFKPGKFVHFVQNLHIYDRHLESAEILRNRKAIPKQPYIFLKANEGKSFYKYTIDDFRIGGVEDIPTLPHKLELAI